jgi:hypothetical protein
MTKVNTLQELFLLPNYKELVEEKLTELAKEKPDFRYSYIKDGMCSYNTSCTDFGTLAGPECDGCIFGQAFQRLGIPKENLCINISIDKLLLLYRKVPITSWTFVQKAQDNGDTWGEAIKYLD